MPHFTGALRFDAVLPHRTAPYGFAFNDVLELGTPRKTVQDQREGKCTEGRGTGFWLS